MKKVFVAMMAAVTLSSCGKVDEKSDVFVSDGKWHKIEAEKIEGNFVQAMNDAMLLTAGREGDLNTMTIGWGEIGKLWGRPVVTVYVSKSRYTYEFMEKNDYFTVTGFPEKYKGSVMYMGKKSGRDGDKIGEGGLHVEYTETGNPIFEEANLAIECRKIYECELDTALAPMDVRGMYEKIEPHVMYVGEIVGVWRK